MWVHIEPVEDIDMMKVINISHTIHISQVIKRDPTFKVENDAISSCETLQQ